MSQSRIVSQDEPTPHEIEIQLEDRKLLEQIRGRSSLNKKTNQMENTTIGGGMNIQKHFYGGNSGSDLSYGPPT